MTRPPSLRAFLRTHPNAATGLVRPTVVVAVVGVAVVAMWLCLAIGVIGAWHASGARGVVELLGSYLLDFVLPLIAATVFAAWLAWNDLVHRWLLARGTWAMSNDTLLVVTDDGERCLIPFDAVIEIQTWARGYPILILDPATPEAGALVERYTKFRRGNPGFDRTSTMEHALERLGVRDRTRWDRVGTGYDFSHPTAVYRRRA